MAIWLAIHEKIVRQLIKYFHYDDKFPINCADLHAIDTDAVMCMACTVHAIQYTQLRRRSWAQPLDWVNFYTRIIYPQSQVVEKKLVVLALWALYLCYFSWFTIFQTKTCFCHSKWLAFTLQGIFSGVTKVLQRKQASSPSELYVLIKTTLQ